MKENITGIKWYWLLRHFCLEEDCFLVINPDSNKIFLDLDNPINQYRGNHYLKVNILKTAIGYRVGRGKKNLIIHRSLLSLVNNPTITQDIIPWDFSERETYKEKAKQLRQQKRDVYNTLFTEKMNHPAYAKKVQQNKKREEWIDKTQKKNQEKSTASEKLLLKTALKRFGKRVKTQYEVTIKGHIYFLDFYIKSLKVAIEVDGGYHSTIEQSQKDRERDANLASIGIKTIRIKNEQVPIKACIDELISVLLSRAKKNGNRADNSVDTYYIGQKQ